MNEKIVRLKSKIKEHLPEIASAVVAVAAVTYAVHTKTNTLKSEGCSAPDAMRMAVDDDCIEKLKQGETLTWHYDGHHIDLAHANHLY